MRHWISTLVALVLLAGSVVLAGAATRKAAKASSLVYVCPESGVGADHATACPICKKAMGRVATYACLKCQISSDATGPCPSCHQPLKSMASLYRRCSTCGYYYVRSKSSCPVCARKHHKLARR